MIEFTLPSLGADMDEGTLVAWLIAPGDTVERGQVVAEVETDKGIIEVECWHDGYVDELLLEPSDTKLSVGTPIAVLRSSDDAGATERAEDRFESPTTGPARSEDGTTGDAMMPRMSPPIRHLAHELGVDVEQLVPTSRGGAVTRDDVRRAAETSRLPNGRPRATPLARRAALRRGIDLGTVIPSRSDGLIVVEDLPATAAPRTEAPDPVRNMRKAISRSMERSKREIPHYYLGTQIDLSVAMRWLEKTNEERSLTRRVLPAALLLRAVAVALREAPDLNGHWIEGAFVPGEAIHVGVAVSLRTGGLVAPAILNADALGIDEMMTALTDLVARARSGRLRSSEMSDATVTVTSLGERGADIVFPIIVPPQVAMVGFGKITERPVVADGSVVVHPVVDVSLTADHRVTDGHGGGLFLHAVDRLLQEPENL